ncbi:hypothetical protein BC827DRAFT_121102 [Russula dissimulans]|nr:hypothetical protein BC827DRAFT_121102 [Russula dissimulans]
MPLPHYYVYREQLTSLFHGHALWEPDPANVYPQVSVGDVGYVREGYFYRLFNVLLEWDHPSNRILVQPEPYTRLDLGPFTNIRESVFSRGDYYSRNVIPSQESDNLRAEGPDDFPPTKYSCRRKQGALLTLPHDGSRSDVIRTKVFEDYIRDNVDSWFAFAQRSRLDVERMEDLILVSGCTLVTSWGAAAFPDNALDAEISLRLRGATFDWHEVRPSVAYHNSHQDPVAFLFFFFLLATRPAVH